MKRISLHVRTGNSRIQESKVKRSVVTNENRTSAVICIYGVTDFPEYSTESIFLRKRRAQRMKGVDTGDRQRCRVEASAFEWLDVKAVCCTAFQRAVRLHVDQHSCDFQQRVC